MADLRRRVAEKKARGLYSVDALMTDPPPRNEPFAAEELERVRAHAVLHYDIDVGPSTKPLIGRPVSRLKRMLVRGVSQPGYSLTAQANSYHGALMAYLGRMANEITALQEAVRQALETAEHAAYELREAGIERQRDLGQLEGRVEEVAQELTELHRRLAQEIREP
jgi:hypothetical protein